MPYLGYVEAHLKIPEIKVVGVDDKQIISKIDNILKLAKDTTIDQFGTIEVKGIIKTPNHNKCVTVVIDDLPKNQCCKDVTVAQQIQVLTPRSNRISVVLRNLSCRTLKVKKGMKIAHVEASNIVPMMVSQEIPENVLKKEAGNAPRSTLLENIPNAKEERIRKILESLNLQGIKSWNEQQQQSARTLIREYQHLFALTLNELGKTSLVQHDIKLDDKTPFKARYQRIPPHQYEEVRKHLQEMLDIGAMQ